MRSRQDRPSLLLSLPVTVLLWWGTVKTWFLLHTDWALVPVLLAFFSVIASFETLLTSIHALLHFVMRREALGRSDQKGSAHWASSQELKKNGLYDTEGVFLGCDLNGHPVFFKGETNGLTVSPGGGGKTISFVVPALCHVPLPMVVTDYKGTLACMTKNLRIKRHKQNVVCANPANLFEKELGPSASYNPMQILVDDWADPRTHPYFIPDSRTLGYQLYPDPPSMGENLYWRNGSRKLLTFGSASLVTQRPEKANLSELLSLLRNTQNLREACYIASCSDILNGELAEMGVDILSQLDSHDTRQIDSFRQGAIQVLEPFSSSGFFAKSISHCDYRFKDLKEEDGTIYLVADPTIKDFSAWVGVLGWAAITELTRCRNTKQVFFLLDEATNFRIENLTHTLTGLREYGLRVWFVIQELEEYARIYGREALATLLSQTECKQFFSSASQKTCDLVSQMLGDMTVKSASYNLGEDQRTEPIQKSVSEHARRLLTPDEVRRFSDMIVFIKDMAPMHLQKVGYHECRPWNKWVDVNPLFGKPLKGKTKVWLKY